MNIQIKNKFTLLELLIVIAILAILMTLLLPSLGRAREVSERAVCASNLKQLFTGTMLHSQNNDFKLPPVIRQGVSNTTWIYTVSELMNLPATKNPSRAESDLFQCPTAPVHPSTNSSYASNVFSGYLSRAGGDSRYNEVKLTKISVPNAAFYITDFKWVRPSFHGGFFNPNRGEHLGRVQGLFIDGSVLNLKHPQQTTLNPDSTRYWYQWAYNEGR